MEVLVHFNAFFTDLISHRSHHNRQRNHHFSDNVAFILILFIIFACFEKFFYALPSFLNHKTKTNRSHWIMEWPYHSVAHFRLFFMYSSSFLSHKKYCATPDCGISTSQWLMFWAFFLHSMLIFNLTFADVDKFIPIVPDQAGNVKIWWCGCHFNLVSFT